MMVTNWLVDPNHSDVQFKIKHLVISSITGSFNNFQGGATSSGKYFDNAEIHFSLDVSSIDTNVEERDKHLKSSDFFDANRYPTITFQSNSFQKLKGDLFKLTGLLTLKGITKPIELDAEYGGMETDLEGHERVAFEVKGRISRHEFGLNYSMLTSAGSLVVGEDVLLIGNIQLIKQN